MAVSPLRLTAFRIAALRQSLGKTEIYAKVACPSGQATFAYVSFLSQNELNKQNNQGKQSKKAQANQQGGFQHTANHGHCFTKA